MSIHDVRPLVLTDVTGGDTCFTCREFWGCNWRAGVEMVCERYRYPEHYYADLQVRQPERARSLAVTEAVLAVAVSEIAEHLALEET